MIRVARPLPARAVTLAAVLLAGAATALALAAARAFTLAAPPDPIAPAAIAPATPAAGPVQLSAADPATELDNDPFAPDRQLPEYASEDALDGPEGAEAPVVPTTLVIRILGTVTLPGGGGFAIYQMPSEVPKTLRVGERVGELTLISVEPGKAVFRSRNGSHVTLTLIPTGA